MVKKSLRVLAAILGILTVVPLGHLTGGYSLISSSAFAEENPSVVTNYRSIGKQSNNLAGGDSSTASVGQGLTAVTFTAISLPANIGAGDKLVLDPSGLNETAYILSRDSATGVTLQTAVQNDHSSGVSYTITRSYTSIQAWENDRQGDLVGDNRREVGVAFNDGPFNETILIEGSTTGIEHYMHLTVADGHRHNGSTGTGVTIDGQDTEKFGIQIQDNYTRIDGFELKRFRGDNGAAAIEIEDAANVLFNRLLIHDFASAGNSVVGIKGSDNSQFTARNCIIFDGDTAGIRITQSSGSGVIQNCTIYGMSGRGVYEDDGTLTVTNTISMANSQEDFDIGQGQQSYNVSSDDTASGTGSLTDRTAVDNPDPGLGDWVVFENLAAGSENFHLKDSSENDALDTGMDISTVFSDDIDGDPRPLGAAWDIGADESGITQPNSDPTAPSNPYCNEDSAQGGYTNPTGITDPTPAFSAVFNDPDAGDIADKYRVEVNTQSDFSGTVLWDSGASGTSMSSTPAGSRCPDIIYHYLIIPSTTGGSASGTTAVRKAL